MGLPDSQPPSAEGPGECHAVIRVRAAGEAKCTVAALAEGLDPWWGFYHKPRHGRPALALDLMEEFRPLVVDSAVITAINTGMVTAGDFTRSQAGCLLTDYGAKGVDPGV